MAWHLDDIDWSRFEPDKVDPDIVKVVKAASLVESAADDYVAYLCGIFVDDPDFQADARVWGEEENQHGRALAAWAERADPDFDFARAFAAFQAGFRVPLGADASVRGSRSGELVARCVVECGTSSLYSALRDAADEPVLKTICHNIAGDEFRHYRLFEKALKRYLKPEPLPLWRRAWIAVGRVSEASDDELAMAWYCGNGLTVPYDRKACARAYEYHAGRLYRGGHLARMVAMIAKAVGVAPQGRLSRGAQQLAWGFMRRRIAWLGRRHAAA
ncbi:MAG: ferritin-like domain-containing protein [Alphaproteobacteria bacterium]